MTEKREPYLCPRCRGKRYTTHPQGWCSRHDRGDAIRQALSKDKRNGS